MTDIHIAYAIVMGSLLMLAAMLLIALVTVQ
jgi:hypothetical protein